MTPSVRFSADQQIAETYKRNAPSLRRRTFRFEGNRSSNLAQGICASFGRAG
jgi:hypothetical protein